VRFGRRSSWFVLRGVKRSARRGESRSRAIERLLLEGLAARARQAVAARELALINTHADALNAEADDVLAYQGDV
jgi:hypothetical protein